MRKHREMSVTLENIEDTDFDIEAFLQEIDSDDTEVEWSFKFKRKINRLFRERVGTKRVVHPEVDNAYERIRSKIIFNFYRITDKIKKKCKKITGSKAKMSRLFVFYINSVTSSLKVSETFSKESF